VGGYLGISGIQHITTDSIGYRSNGRVDYASSEPFRIFAIGASTTEEIDLDDSKTWTHLLEQRLSDQMGQQVEVINTGLSGLRAVNNVATLEKILPLNPDLAIFLVGVNDWNHQIRLGTEGFWQREVASRTEPFWFGNTLLGKFLRSYKLSTRNTGSVADTMAVEMSGEYYELMRDSLNRPDVRRFRPQAATHGYSENIRRICNICESAELRCMFMTQPTAYSPNVEDELRANFWMTPPNKDYTLDLDSMMRIANLYNNFLLEFAKGEQLPYCDLAARMPPSVDYFTDDCHFNEHGAERVSRIIADCVLDQI
jgi:lysophospholipase L1-like esterase